jgi:amino acid permease
MEQHHNTTGNGLPTYAGEPRHSGDVDKGRQLSFSAVDPEMVQTNQLHQSLKGRHMQMIAM